VGLGSNIRALSVGGEELMEVPRPPLLDPSGDRHTSAHAAHSAPQRLYNFHGFSKPLRG